MKLFLGLAAVLAQSMLVAGFGLPRIVRDGDETELNLGRNPRIGIELEKGELPELELEYKAKDGGPEIDIEWGLLQLPEIETFSKPSIGWPAWLLRLFSYGLINPAEED